jgi:small subunit ribosomal protein S3
LVAMKKAEAHVQLKPGIIGVRVKIMPPDAYFPDRIKVSEAAPPEETAAISQPPAQPAATQEATPTAKAVPTEAEEPAIQTAEVQDEPKKEEAKQ